MKRWLALIGALPLLAFAAPQEKIVTLGGDVTEIVYALGAASSLVASGPRRRMRCLMWAIYASSTRRGSYPCAPRWCWPVLRRSRLWR